MIKFLAAALACEGPQNLPGQHIDVHFDSDSSEISRTELARLSASSSDIRNRFPISDTVWLAGLAEATERTAQQLAYRRARKQRHGKGSAMAPT
ncbi:hypothetical protein WI29_31075 [Burkholderia ubonensis]|nr:hypothetical protein WI31_26325 [Burkholderia ubonensis]KUZ10491.1 hypothetical protein WI29_31075 [Burkholderia ubonensis]KUZ27198.1 hypothetical protein WI30_25280 [Burkholderia ubonensis]KUZ55389.1 hypothetical protein WI34_22505 [Burkholderia ubonensis]KUZ56751.1 hypothetical protein WI33_04755 [Burkholderia ubonensis]